MADISENSYGTINEVAALVRRYTERGYFNGTTRPTHPEVVQFINRVSSIINVLMAECGFTPPASNAMVKDTLSDFVIGQVVALCHGANGAGPFTPSSETLRGTTPFRAITKEAETFIKDHADGFEALGEARSRSLTYGLDARLTDDGGNALQPFFSREQMGHYITDWDTDG